MIKIVVEAFYVLTCHQACLVIKTGPNTLKMNNKTIKKLIKTMKNKYIYN